MFVAWIYKHETLAGGFGAAVVVIAHSQYSQMQSGKGMDNRVDALEFRLQRKIDDAREKNTREIKNDLNKVAKELGKKHS